MSLQNLYDESEDKKTRLLNSKINNITQLNYIIRNDNFELSLEEINILKEKRNKLIKQL